MLKKVTVLKTGKTHRIFAEPNDGEGGVECDSAVFSRMRKKVYQELGAWKRWLPYYGILDAYEAEVTIPIK